MSIGNDERPPTGNHVRFAPRLVAAAARWRATPRRVRRRLGRRVALTAAGTALTLSMVAGPLLPSVRAATITVDETTCTLVDAIRSANAGTSYGGCITGSGFDAIQLEADVTLTGAFGNYYGSDTGLPLITSALSINGNGHTIARDTNYAPFRLMAVGPTGELTLEDATLTGGDSLNGGGALINGGGEVYIFDSTFTGNTAFAGGAIYNYQASAAVVDSAITGNGANYGGGAINGEGAAYFVNSTISGNFAFSAAGLYSFDSFMAVYSSAVVYNFAYFGAGGVTNVAQGHVDIFNSTVSGNFGGLNGGGIFSNESTTHPFPTTISGNYAYFGGGIATSYLYVLGGAGASAHAEGNRLISTQGRGAVPGLNGPIRFGGEDVLGFWATALGPTTQGKWTLVVDGSAEGMPANSLANQSASDNGKTLYLMTRAAFNVDSAVGGHSMVYQFDLGSEVFTGPTFIAAGHVEGVDYRVAAGGRVDVERATGGQVDHLAVFGGRQAGRGVARHAMKRGRASRHSPQSPIGHRPNLSFATARPGRERAIVTTNEETRDERRNTKYEFRETD